MKGFVLPFALVTAFIVAGGVPANAGTIWVVPPEAPTYLINASATNVDVLEAFIETPSGVTFDNLGFANLDAGWNAAIVNSTYAVEYGPASSSLTEDLDLIGTPLTVDFYAFTGCVSFPCAAADLSDAYAVHFSGGAYGGWTPLTSANLSSENTTPAAPEPAAVLMIGAGLIGIAVRLKALARRTAGPTNSLANFGKTRIAHFG